MTVSRTLRSLAAVACFAAAGSTHADVVALSKLTGVTGGGTGLQTNTAVYKANLGALSGNFAAISISDASGSFGGATGQFSGFDLDAIKLSWTDCADAACANAALGLNVFNFVSGLVFSPGSQRAPVDAKLFGTGAGGNTVDNGVAALGSFDGISSTGADATGFLSLGDNGSLAFNLTALTAASGLFLYIGEVGDNGEVAGSNISIERNPVPVVPEPSTYALMLGGLAAVAWLARRQRRAA